MVVMPILIVSVVGCSDIQYSYNFIDNVGQVRHASYYSIISSVCNLSVCTEVTALHQ